MCINKCQESTTKQLFFKVNIHARIIAFLCTLSWVSKCVGAFTKLFKCPNPGSHFGSILRLAQTVLPFIAGIMLIN